MNIDTIAGEGSQMKGQLKQDVGSLTGDQRLQQSGAADQLSGSVRKGVGAVRDLARRQPLATAAAAGIFGLAILRALGGKRRAA